MGIYSFRSLVFARGGNPKLSLVGTVMGSGIADCLSLCIPPSGR